MIRERNIWRKKKWRIWICAFQKCSYFIGESIGWRVFRSSTSFAETEPLILQSSKSLEVRGFTENERRKLRGSQKITIVQNFQISSMTWGSTIVHFLLIFYEAWILFFTTALIDGSLERFFGGYANGWSCAAIHRWEFSTQQNAGKDGGTWITDVTWLGGGFQFSPRSLQQKWSNLTNAHIFQMEWLNHLVEEFFEHF